MKKTIVLIGKISSGKDYAGAFLAEKLGGKVLGISSSLRILARQRNIEENRENLIALGKEVAKKYGDGYLAEVLVKNSPEDLLIITGPRQLGQLEYLRKNTQSYFIAIESDENIRYLRMKQRGKIGENISFEKFCELEKMEESTIQKVETCMKLADITIENNGSIDDFEQKLNIIDFHFKENEKKIKHFERSVLLKREVNGFFCNGCFKGLYSSIWKYGNSRLKSIYSCSNYTKFT